MIDNYNIITKFKIIVIIVITDSRTFLIDKYNYLLNSSNFFSFYTSNKTFLYLLKSISLLLSLTTYFYIFFYSLKVKIILILDRL